MRRDFLRLKLNMMVGEIRVGTWAGISTHGSITAGIKVPCDEQNEGRRPAASSFLQLKLGKGAVPDFPWIALPQVDAARNQLREVSPDGSWVHM